MPTIKLNCCDPTNPVKPYVKQAEFLFLNRRGPHTSRNHWVGGRGSAKTTTGVLLAFSAAFKWMPGLDGVWTEPTYRLCNDIFLAEWQRIVPRELYKINKSEMMIECASGSHIFIRSRNVDNISREVVKGLNLGWGIEDEEAYKYDKQKYWDVDAAIRIDTPYRFHDTLTTPKLNEYYNLIHDDNGNIREGHRLVTATSYDNPYLPTGWAHDLAGQMDERYMEQEVLGRWISLRGRIWNSWSEAEWPDGNIHPHEHNYDNPYWLFFDLGVASSAWVVVQNVRPLHNGVIHPNYAAHDSVWVATAELTPSREEGGHIDRILPIIKQEYGIPVQVVCGHDLNTRSSIDASTARSIVNNHFGAIPIRIIGESGSWLSDKENQGRQLAYGILDTKGRRRFCVSQKFKRFHPKTKRGIMELMLQDTWPSLADQRLGINVYPKENKLEHVRDALFYGSVATMFPPSQLLRGTHVA